jgi:hypothetical protein
VAIALTASDESGGSGVASIIGSFNGGAEEAVDGASAVATIAAPRDHSNDGVTTLSYCATDKAGNREAAHTANVKIDTRGPTCAAKNAIVRRGKKGRLYFAVRDALSPQATQTIHVKTRRGATKKTFSWGYDDVRGPGQWWYVNCRWTLKKGTTSSSSPAKTSPATTPV